ncbi:MAG: hypothetical protein J6U92_02635 [Clostridia bacterium]|nr:hypothetical protein [Clostridia bacterium]
MQIKIKNIFLVFLKILTVISSIGGVLLSLINATFDGYSAWYKRAYYFTAQSNIWLGLTFFIILLNRSQRIKEKLYIFKFIFTVSISITAIIFCSVLAPFADESYHVWSLSGILTHVISPALALTDYFLDDYKIKFKKHTPFLAVLPPLIYFLVVSIMHLLKIDFGRGQTFPYFFLNFFSPAGIFGFSNQPPFFLGVFYWIILVLLAVIFISFILSKIKKTKNS